MKENYIDDDCKYGASSNFFKSLGSQLGGMFGFSQAVDHSGIDINSELMKKIMELQTELKNVQWQCSQKIILAQDVVNEQRKREFTSLKDYLDENMEYISTKYIFEIKRLGILDGVISIMTSLIVVVILYFLKFK